MIVIIVEMLNKIYCIFKYYERLEDVFEIEIEELRMWGFFYWVVMVCGGDGILIVIDSFYGVVLVNIVIIIGYCFD